MTDYPQLRSLVAELCRLSVDDVELPLGLILRMCRGQLCAPLENFASWTTWARNHDEAAHLLQGQFAVLYPTLANGKIFGENEALSKEIEHPWNRVLRSNGLRKTLTDSERLPAALDPLLRDWGRGWVAFDPLVQLWAIGRDLQHAKSHLGVLEIQLGLDEIVPRMILEIATGSV